MEEHRRIVPPQEILWREGSDSHVNGMDFSEVTGAATRDFIDYETSDPLYDERVQELRQLERARSWHSGEGDKNRQAPRIPTRRGNNRGYGDDGYDDGDGLDSSSHNSVTQKIHDNRKAAAAAAASRRRFDRGECNRSRSFDCASVHSYSSTASSVSCSSYGHSREEQLHIKKQLSRARKHQAERSRCRKAAQAPRNPRRSEEIDNYHRHHQNHHPNATTGTTSTSNNNHSNNNPPDEEWRSRSYHHHRSYSYDYDHCHHYTSREHEISNHTGARRHSRWESDNEYRNDCHSQRHYHGRMRSHHSDHHNSCNHRYNYDDDDDAAPPPQSNTVRRASSEPPVLKTDGHHHHHYHDGRWSNHRHQNNQQAPTRPPRRNEHERRPPTEVEIQPGVSLPLRGKDETLHALECHYVVTTTCIACNVKVKLIADAEFLLCPLCKSVGPIEENSGNGGGVGLGVLVGS